MVCLPITSGSNQDFSLYKNGRAKRFQTSIFDIPCSIFDIHFQPIGGSDIYVKLILAVTVTWD
jgi:hypothetical protein